MLRCAVDSRRRAAASGTRDSTASGVLATRPRGATPTEFPRPSDQSVRSASGSASVRWPANRHINILISSFATFKASWIGLNVAKDVYKLLNRMVPAPRTPQVCRKVPQEQRLVLEDACGNRSPAFRPPTPFVTRRVLFAPENPGCRTIMANRIPTKPVRRKVGTQRAHRDSGAVRSGTRCGVSNGPSRAHQTGPVPSRLRRMTSVRSSGCESIRKARGPSGLRSEVAPRAYGPSSSTEGSWRTGFFVLGEEGRCIRH